MLFRIACVVYVFGEGFAQLIALGHFREDTKILLHGQHPGACLEALCGEPGLAVFS